ncbi:MAG: TRAP transporter large permease [Clostridiaceae bacterium]|jgi:tripartite ATP-independent transporter DctM subunit|nr:TRAP transporter large permease [Clostridiaceae bacterium]
MPDLNLAIGILFGTFIFLLILRVPISISLIISSIATALYLKIPLLIISQRMVKGVESFSLLAIPFFIIAGEMMGSGGMSKRLIDLSNVFVGRIQGGLAQINVLTSMIFGGISGSAVADVSSEGTIIIPVMKQKGYDDDFSVAVTVATSCEGVIIPPSHNMIIYAVAAGGVSVGRLFMAGIIPGILLGLATMILCFIIAKKRNYPKEEKISFIQGIKIIWKSLLGIGTIVIIMVGVLSGMFTATESAAIAALYAFIVTFFVYREIPLKAFKGILFNTLKTLSMVMSLIAAASAFGYLMAYLRVPAMATELLMSISQNKYVLLFLINVLLLILGCVMDMAPIIIICTPILMPVITAIGVSPIHFGIILMLNLSVGLCTPPVGSALFVGCAVGKISIEKVTKALLPFYAVMVLVTLLVTYIPDIAMFLPNLVMK